MTFDINEWARSPAGRRFHYYDPYLTYVDPDNYGFISPAGKPTQELNCDTEALFRLGKQAFNRLVPQGECTREEFDEGYAGYWKMIDESRESLAVKYDEGKLRPISDITGKPISLDFKQIDDNQIVSLCWQMYSAPWFKGPAKEDVKNVFLPLFLFHTLREIDNALIGIAFDGGGVVAAIYAADALSNAIAIESGDEQLTQARKHFAYQAAIEKLKRDPRQNEKTFVDECWRDWQKKPNSYKSKAAFARDMLTKCEHLKSQKKIEDWCREWENGALPAE